MELRSAEFRGAAPARALSGRRAQRIVDAMRKTVATRGIAGATFEQVAREAGVSRGLLHYYFGTKERLLIEVLRRELELRLWILNDALAGAETADDVISGLVSGSERVLEDDPGFYVILFELFVAGRGNEEIQHELAELYRRSRVQVADALRQKEEEGVVRLRFDAEACVTYMFAATDGAALQRLTDPEADFSGLIETVAAVAEYLLQAPS